jgi:peptidyl-prolyl cis-trans isomerase D
MIRIAILLVAAVTTATWAVRSDEKPPGAPARRSPPKLSELFGDEVLARGKGIEVKRSDLEGAFIAYKANLASRGQPISEDKRTGQEAQLLQRLIVTQILTNRVTEADRRVAEDLAKEFVADSKKQSASEDAFYRQLKALGMTPEQFQQRVNEQALAEAVIKREINSKIEISDARVKDFYNSGTDLLVNLLQEDLEKLVKDPSASAGTVARVKERIDEVRKTNLARMEQPERVRVGHIFFATQDRKTEESLPEDQKKLKRQQAEKARAKALAGEDFSKLVAELSEDRSVKETKGEYTFSRNDPFVPEFKAAAFTLEPGKISDVVASSLGYHVIKLLEKIPPKKAEFEKVAKELKDLLMQQEVQRAMPNYFARATKEAGVEILDPKYKLDITGDLDSKKP